MKKFLFALVVGFIVTLLMPAWRIGNILPIYPSSINPAKIDSDDIVRGFPFVNYYQDKRCDGKGTCLEVLIVEFSSLFFAADWLFWALVTYGLYSLMLKKSKRLL